MTTNERPSVGTQTIQFRVGRGDGSLARDLQSRADTRLSPDLVARRDLERYYELMRRTLPRFIRNEALAILDVCNGTLWEPWSVTLLWASVSDTDGLGAKWGIDQAALAERLRGLNYAECLAIVDAAERFWAAIGNGQDDETDAALAACGLARQTNERSE